MGVGYQDIDRNVIDYDIWFVDDGRLALRGPRTDLNLDDVNCCIGAAQTFGRFVARPFPVQISQILRKPVLNLGFSGAGPEFFLNDSFLMSRLARAGLVVIQAMSARSVSAGVFRAGGNNGVLEFVEGPRQGERMLAQESYSTLRAEYGEPAFRDQIAAVQARWLALHRQLINHIAGQKVLLWLSQKKPGDNIDLTTSPVGVFPHFVSAEMVHEVSALCDCYVDATFEDMQPQVLVNDLSGMSEASFSAERFPQRPDRFRRLNTYYATPEMHDHASALLCEALLKLR